MEWQDRPNGPHGLRMLPLAPQPTTLCKRGVGFRTWFHGSMKSSAASGANSVSMNFHSVSFTIKK